MEILHAVEDLIKIIRAHPLYDHLETVSEEEVTKLKKHYNHFMYQVNIAEWSIDELYNQHYYLKPSLRLNCALSLFRTDLLLVLSTLVAAAIQALLHCAKNSMNMLKNRIQSRTGGTGAFLFVQKPFFEVGLRC